MRSRFRQGANKVLRGAAKPVKNTVMPFLRHILRHRFVDLTHFVPIYVDHEQIGWTKRDFAKLLATFDFAWVFTENRLVMNDALDTFEKKSNAVHDVFMEISAQGHYPIKPDYSLMGGEDWLPVGQDRWTNPIFQVHRFYASCLGIRRESVLLHGYEDDKMWLAVRGAGVDDAVGCYDMIASGCMTIGQGRHEALLYEAEEECGMTEETMQHIKSGAELHVMFHHTNGFIIDEIFHVFDLNTKDTFTPKVVKKLEVDHFELLTITEVLELIEKTERIKPAIAMTLVDFMIRYGYLKQDTPAYAQIIEELSTPYSIAA